MTESSTQQEDPGTEADVTVLVAPVAATNHYQGCAEVPGHGSKDGEDLLMSQCVSAPVLPFSDHGTGLSPLHELSNIWAF